MVKRDDSVRSLGQASIGTDKPTLAKLKAAAAANGYKTLNEYLRYLAKKETEGLQVTLSGISVPHSQPGDAGVLCSQCIEMAKILPLSDAKRLAVISLATRLSKYNDVKHSRWLFDKLQSQLEEYEGQMASKEAGQLEMEYGDA